MKKLSTITTMAVLLMMAGSLVSCESTSDIEQVHSYIKVENASEFGSVVEVKMMRGDIELSRVNWKGNGFTPVLPKTISPSLLSALIDNHGLPTTLIINSSTATISNKNAQTAGIHFLGVDRNDNRVAVFYPVVIDENGNQISMRYDRVRFEYVNSDVTVSGYVEHTYGRYNTTHIFSIEWKKGWNVLWISDSVLGEKAISKWLTIPRNRLKWYGREWMEAGKDI